MLKLSPGKRKFANGLLTLLYLAAFVLSMIGDIIDNWTLMGIFKMLFVPVLFLLVRINWNGAMDDRYKFLKGALLLAWVGDLFVFLCRFDLLYFTIGGILFFVQHVIYILLNLKDMAKDDSLRRIVYWGLPTMAYIAVLNLNFWLNISLANKLSYTAFYRSLENRRKYWACILGFGFFTASDMIIAVDRFAYRLPRVQSSLILLTYYIAQTLICYGYNPDKEASACYS
eukprot:TRINITY_DN405_c0_g1_i25.p1 TRINITY_DN405_c0_g1~~TRINITY_DN405_c0_g1_i25.p1  ORF type:complete len:228 (-),score=52.38 TRINITY_DN405_c0_g1_i25:106-789(-)